MFSTPLSLINWEKCALTNVLPQKHSSISLAYIEKWSNRDVLSPKHLSAACLTGEIRLCWQNEFLFTTGQFPSSNFSKRFNFFVLFFGRTQERRLSVIQRLSIQQLPPSLVTWLLIKHGIHNDSSSVLSTYISICRRLFSNLLHTGRSAMRKWSSQAAN